MSQFDLGDFLPPRPSWVCTWRGSENSRVGRRRGLVGRESPPWTKVRDMLRPSRKRCLHPKQEKAGQCRTTTVMGSGKKIHAQLCCKGNPSGKSQKIVNECLCLEIEHTGVTRIRERCPLRQNLVVRECPKYFFRLALYNGKVRVLEVKW